MNSDGMSEWDKAAAVYSKTQMDSVYSLFNREFVKSFVCDPRGKRLLDAGCGDGYYAQHFHEQGASVIGCDGSSQMIRLARTQYPAVRFDMVDLQAELPYQDGQFDLIFCNQVLMDIEHVERFASEISRLLKSGGTFCFSIVHPCFFLGDWEFDQAGKKTAKRTSDYLAYRSEKQHFWGVTTHYHRPLSFYFNLFSARGLTLDEMREPAIPADDAASRIPLFLFARLTKR